jgi:hypothetical protein
METDQPERRDTEPRYTPLNRKDLQDLIERYDTGPHAREPEWISFGLAELPLVVGQFENKSDKL